MFFSARNGAANHRANDVLVKEGSPQILSARFSYGPLDMAALSGERVDIHIMKEPPAGDWMFVSTEITDKAGRLCFKLPTQVIFKKCRARDSCHTIVKQKKCS